MRRHRLRWHRSCRPAGRRRITRRRITSGRRIDSLWISAGWWICSRWNGRQGISRNTRWRDRPAVSIRSGLHRSTGRHLSDRWFARWRRRDRRNRFDRWIDGGRSGLRFDHRDEQLSSAAGAGSALPRSRVGNADHLTAVRTLKFNRHDNTTPSSAELEPPRTGDDSALAPFQQPQAVSLRTPRIANAEQEQADDAHHNGPRRHAHGPPTGVRPSR